MGPASSGSFSVSQFQWTTVTAAIKLHKSELLCFVLLQPELQGGIAGRRNTTHQKEVGLKKQSRQNREICLNVAANDINCVAHII